MNDLDHFHEAYRTRETIGDNGAWTNGDNTIMMYPRGTTNIANLTIDLVDLQVEPHSVVQNGDVYRLVGYMNEVHVDADKLDELKEAIDKKFSYRIHPSDPEVPIRVIIPNSEYEAIIAPRIQNDE